MALHKILKQVQDDNIKVLLVCPGFIRTNISLNALNADGTPTNKMDKNQEEGMSPQLLAQKILNAIRKETQEIYVGGKEILAIHIKRLFPGLLSKIIKKRH